MPNQSIFPNFLAVALLALPLCGQGPALECTFAPSKAGAVHGLTQPFSYFQITVKNGYEQTATAYALLTKSARDAGGEPFQSYIWVNAVPPDNNNQPIYPHGYVTHGMGEHLLTLYSVAPVATIYADGTTVGNQIYIDEFLKERSLIETDLQFSIPLITDAAQHPVPDYLKQLARTFKQRGVAHQKQMYANAPTLGGHRILRVDRVCTNLSSSLALWSTLGEDMRETKIRGELAAEQQELLAIEISQPHVEPQAEGGGNPHS